MFATCREQTETQTMSVQLTVMCSTAPCSPVSDQAEI